MERVPVFIHPDNVIECTEAFQVKIHVPDRYLSQGIQLGHPSTTTIFINNGWLLSRGVYVYSYLPSLKYHFIFCYITRNYKISIIVVNVKCAWSSD